MTLKTISGYIKCFFSIGYLEIYVNCKSDYLELLLSVHGIHVHVSTTLPRVKEEARLDRTLCPVKVEKNSLNKRHTRQQTCCNYGKCN